MSFGSLCLYAHRLLPLTFGDDIRNDVPEVFLRFEQPLTFGVIEAEASVHIEAWIRDGVQSGPPMKSDGIEPCAESPSTNSRLRG